MSSKLSFEVGNCKFWEDTWLGATPISVSFLLLFAVAASKEVWVKEYWGGSTSG